MYPRKLLLSSVAVSLMLPAAPVLSQELEEIIVTARKREESILKVPIAATAYTGEQLERFNTDDLYTLTERVPGFVMGTQVASIGPTPSLRGIGTGTLNPTIDQSVALNIDGMGFSQALAFTSGMFDLQQMEVLRGPQSLFYGKNSTAGVISLTTRDPGDEFELILGTAYESVAEEKVGEFIISGPVTDTLGLRLAVKYTDMEGWLDNDAIGDGITSFTPKVDTIPNKDETVVRGTALWEPSDRFNAKLKVNYLQQDMEGSGGAGQLNACPDGTVTPDLSGLPGLGPILVALYGGSPQFYPAHEDCDFDDSLNVVDVNPNHPLYIGIRNNGTPFFELDQSFGSLQMNYDLTPELTLNSVTGYQQTQHEVMINGGQTGFAGPLIIADTDFDRRDFTQELRLTSNYEGIVNFMLGAYYQDGNMRNRTGLFFLGPRDRGAMEINIDTISFFGQTTFTFNPRWELSAGLRWTDEERDFSAVNLATGEPFDPSLYGNVDELNAENVSPEVALTYTPTDDLTFFVSYREAFKSGSWDTVSNPRGIDLAFGDENVRGYEGGMKARFLDNTLALNFSAYSYKYDDLQVGANQSTPQGFTIVTLNAASADVYGVDFDFTYAAPIEGLEVFGVANWNHARYDDFEDAQCWGGQTAFDGCNRLPDPDTGLFNAQDLSGGELLRAPDLQATLGFTYEWAIAGGDMLMSVGSSTQWSDEFASNTLLRDDFFQDSFFKTSASLGLRAASGAWEVSLVGKNLNDEITAGNCTNFNGVVGNVPGTILTGSPTGQRGIAGVDETVCIPERGRELWLELKLRPMLF